MVFLLWAFKKYKEDEYLYLSIRQRNTFSLTCQIELLMVWFLSLGRYLFFYIK